MAIGIGIGIANRQEALHDAVTTVGTIAIILPVLALPALSASAHLGSATAALALPALALPALSASAHLGQATAALALPALAAPALSASAHLGSATAALALPALAAPVVAVTTAAFKPWDLSDCIVALRADLGITLNGANVSAWADQTGLGHNVVQAVAAKQPPFAAAAGPNAKPCVQFDGIDDCLKAVGFTWNQPEHVFVIAKPSTLNDTTGTLWDGNAGNDLRGYLAAGYKLIMYAGANLNADGGERNVWYEFRCRYQGAANSQLIWNDTTEAGVNAGTNNAGGLTLGAYGSGASELGDCEIAELVGYTVALGANAMLLLDWYAGQRYAL